MDANCPVVSRFLNEMFARPLVVSTMYGVPTGDVMGFIATKFEQQHLCECDRCREFNEQQEYLDKLSGN